VAVLLILAAVFVTVPLLVAAAMILWLQRTSFASVDELKAEELETVQIQMRNLVRGPQNRPEPPILPAVKPDENTSSHHDDDIPQTDLFKGDFDAILAPLREAELIEHNQWPACAMLGEIRVRYKDGRPGTIRLYQTPDDPRREDSPQRVYMKIGSSWYRACLLKQLREVAHTVADRGTKVGK
jgi:hypothetical protein